MCEIRVLLSDNLSIPFWLFGHGIGHFHSLWCLVSPKKSFHMSFHPNFTLVSVVSGKDVMISFFFSVIIMLFMNRNQVL